MKLQRFSVTALFCDDVRKEEGGSRTIVGAYQRYYRAKSYPILMPRLSVFARCIYDTNDPISDFELRIYKDDKLIVSHPAEAEYLKKSIDRYQSKGETMAALNTSIRMVNFNFKEQCRFVASAIIEGEEMMIGQLTVATIEAARNA